MSSKGILMLCLCVLIATVLVGGWVYGEQTYHKGGNWLKEHKGQAGRASASCNQCHSSSFCADCHNKRQELLPETKNPDAVERSFTHRADFRTRHAGEAKTNPSKCLRCHTNESCQTCHQREGLSVGVANFPHPGGWMSPGSSQFHGRVARQDILLCASCHERGTATNCINCHAVGATTQSPHPPGWKSDLSRSSPVCQKCH